MNPPDATGHAAAIAIGRMTPRAAADAARAACGGDPAVVRLLPRDDVLAAADAAPAGPLRGVPVLAKDLGSAARGLAPAAGCDAMRAATSDPDEDSAWFARLRAAGAVPIGLSAVPPFGFALTTDPVPNPFDDARSPGGSSGGAASAVARGLVPLAHATDAAGSIRVPAACCGLWGLKASRGALVRGPRFDNHLMGLAGDGVVARSLRDVALVHALTASDAPVRPLPGRVRVGMALPDRADDAGRDAVRAVADRFAAAGCSVSPVPAPDDLGAKCHAVAGDVLCVSLAEWLDATWVADVPPLIAAAADRGRALSGPEVFALTREVACLTHAAGASFDACDVLLMPVLSGPPPRPGHFDFAATDVDAHLAAMEAVAPNAAVANVCGLPALAMPAGRRDGLPVGVQVLAPAGTDATLLSLAARIAA
ncbi:amidase [Jannaschia sp. LMIT008]|uniref:amidase n=1 Tax=Jannaschia maritima TaxID=3032585 RepID=UPI002811514B|nr:amidase [Jannaschia sp. LMIT008]